MERTLAATALIILCCGACATVGGSPTAPRLQEALRAIAEGTRLKASGQHAEAVPFFERALVLREEELGKDHPDVADLLRALADLHASQQHYAQAEPLLLRALAIEEAALSESCSLPTALRKLARNDHRVGFHGRATGLRRQAQLLELECLVRYHSRVASSRYSLANLYERQGLYERAQRAYKMVGAASGWRGPKANLDQDLGHFEQTRALHEYTLSVREAILGMDHPDVADSLHALATLSDEQGYSEQARSLYERALAIREAALGRDHPKIADSLQALAIVYDDQGQHARAQSLYERALVIRETVLGRDHLEIVTLLHRLATLHHAQGNYAQAQPLFERSLAIQEAALGRSHPSLATSLHSLAELYSAQGLYARAMPLMERALAIREASFGKTHPEVAASLNTLANLYYFQGLYSQAEPLYQRALELTEAALGKGHPDVATSLHNLALLYSSQGFYAKAEPLYQRAITIEEAALGANHPEVATSLNSLANLYSSQGLYARAQPLMESALTIREDALGKDHPDVADSLNSLANLYSSQTLHAQAEPLMERALAIQEKTLGKHHPDLATSLHNLALSYSAQGLYARAQPLMERALAIREEALGNGHPDVADSLNSLANLHFSQGLYAQAEPLYERAIAIQEKALGKHHPDLATSLHELARLRLAQQRLSEAIPLFKRAFAVSEGHLRQEVFGLSEARLAFVLQRLREDEEYLYTLARAHPENADVRHLALCAALLRKGRSVEEIAETSRVIYRDLPQTDRELFERLRALRTQFSTLSLAGPGPLSPGEYQERLKELAARGDTLETSLARRSAPLRSLYQLPAPDELISRVAAALPRDGVLVEFVTYRESQLITGPGAPPSRRPGQLRYLAFLLFADGRTHTLDLGPAAPIDRAALRLHHAIARRSVSYQSAAQALYKLALRPLVPHLGSEVKRLLVSLDGQLGLVPLAALHDGKRFLIDTFDIVYLTSGKDLLPRHQDFFSASSVVVLAAPDFGAPPAAPSLTGQAGTALAERSATLERAFSTLRSELADQPWAPLPGTRQEAESIHRLFPHAQLLLGSEATKEALLTLETPGILHIATHGFFLEDASAPAAARAVAHFGGLGDSGPPQRPAHPLLRSGLVLAGAHFSASPARSRHYEDSLVTALELAGLNLWDTQLVVLSACDTGRGLVMPGQGIYGLRRAVMVAGAQTLVVSLWKVNDETTRELMEAYYRNLLAGQGRAAALHQAMKALRQKHPHPHFWAPFIAIGQDAPLRGMARFAQARAVP